MCVELRMTTAWRVGNLRAGGSGPETGGCFRSHECKVPMQSSRIIIADPSASIRQSLGDLLSYQGDVEVIAYCRTVGDVVLESIAQRPDAILLGFGFSLPQRLDAARRIAKSWPSAPVLVLADHPDLVTFLGCVKAGARGYLGGNADASRLVDAIRVLSAGGCVLERDIAPELFAYLAAKDTTVGRLTSPCTTTQSLGNLTPRERQVLGLIAQGRTNREIGALLATTENTTKAHVRNIFRKLGVSDRTGAVVTTLDIDLPNLLRPSAGRQDADLTVAASAV
jgi:DNA-binding NarL/FixJ family response regulator